MGKVSVKKVLNGIMRDERERVQDAARTVKQGRTTDSFQNFEARVGLGTNNTSDGGTYGFNPVSRNRTLLEWMHRGNWVAGLAVDILPDDMTRAGVDLLGDLESDKQEMIHEAATTLNVWGSLRDNAAWGRLYGGSIAVHMVKGQDPSTPLRLETIGKDQYRGLVVLDRWMVSPSLGELVTEEGPQMGMPKFYEVNNMAPAYRGKRIHYTRAIRALGNRLPYWQAVSENLWSESILERPYDRLVAFDSATAGASQLVYKAYLRTYAIENLREAIMLGGDAYEGIVKQVASMARFQSIEGITLIDAKDKFEVSQHSAFSGLAEILVHFGQQLSGGFQIPLVRFFGQSPVGLNSTGESDIRTYYENVANLQNKEYKVPVTTIYRALAQSCGIKTKPGFGVRFRPLWLLEEKEKAEIAEIITRTVTSAMDAGVPQKAGMEELKDSASISGIWHHLTKDMIDSASEDMPPTPVEVALINAQAKEESAPSSGTPPSGKASAGTAGEGASDPRKEAEA